jgi:hypothetical protein
MRDAMKKIATLILLLFCSVHISSVSAQEAVEGKWRGEIGFSKMSLSLKSSMRTELGSWNMSFGEDIPLKDFKGLEQAVSSAAAAGFELPREAGTFTFKGKFKNDEGAGEFKFVIDPEFAKNMEALGYKKLAVDQIFHLAINDIGIAFVKELQAAGYDKLPIDKLAQMAIHGVTPAFVKELANLGYKNLSVDQLVQLRIHGVDADYVREMNAAIKASPKK